MTTSIRQMMTEDMQVRHLSPQTQSSYIQQVSLFYRHFNKSPVVLGPEDIRDYQVYLTNEKKLAASSIKVAVAALRFMYRVTLKRPWDFDAVVPSPKRPRSLPIILSPQEVVQFLGCVASIKHRTILTVCYAAGLRISEAVHLMPNAIDRQRMVIRVDQGKGGKDRYVMLSPKLLEVLSGYWYAAHPKGCLFPADHPPCGGEGLPGGTPSVGAFQAGHAAFLEACVCSAFAGIRDRSADHSTADGAQQPQHDGALPADRHQQGLCDNQSAGSAAASGSRRHEAGGTIARLSGRTNGPVGAGSGGRVPPLRRRLS